MTVVWGLVFLIVSAVAGPQTVEFWNAWMITLAIAVGLDILF